MMQIATDTAMKIVAELKKIICQDITFMDTSCHIIACTDTRRIGGFHEATHRMLSENLKELQVVNDEEYAGTCAGVNLVLELDGRTVGVVGITGDYTHVAQYGQIIKKMTEILLLEDHLKEQKRSEYSRLNRFIREWLATDELRVTPALISGGLAVGVDIDRPRRVAAMTISEDAPPADRGDIEREIRASLRESPADLVISNGNKFIAILDNRSDRQLRELMQRVAAAVFARYHVALRIGVDSQPVSGGQLKQSYARAQKAARGAASRSRDGVAMYDEILVELLTNEIPPAVRREFIARVFRNCTAKEINQYKQILNALYVCDGSLNQAAQRLFVHKNTLQYRLNQLCQKTGYNPRRLCDIPLYFLAMAFDDDLADE